MVQRIILKSKQIRRTLVETDSVQNDQNVSWYICIQCHATDTKQEMGKHLRTYTHVFGKFRGLPSETLLIILQLWKVSGDFCIAHFATTLSMIPSLEEFTHVSKKETGEIRTTILVALIDPHSRQEEEETKEKTRCNVATQHENKLSAFVPR